MPTSSSIVSPFMRSATIRAAIWAGVASPASTTSSAARASVTADVLAGSEGPEQV